VPTAPPLASAHGAAPVGKMSDFSSIADFPFSRYVLLDISRIILSNSLENGLFLRSHAESAYNSRMKFYRGSDGQLVPYELMCCNRQVFLESGSELSEFSVNLERELEYKAAAAELFGGEFGNPQHYVAPPKSKQELLDASRRRARRKIFDYIICNEFDMFVTLTLDPSQIDRSDYGAVIKRLNTWLGNRVRRKGIRYIGVPEYHKNGGLHFHFAVNGADKFRLVDSGTVTVEGKKKPIRIDTARRRGYAPEQCHTVYNLPEWKLGFSTAILTYGDRGALAHYLSKELCKDVQKNLVRSGSIDKIGGRWYLHGGQFEKPIVQLSNRNFDDMQGFSYDIVCDGGKFKVYKFSENGEILK
jgi:hypothetical protein